MVERAESCRIHGPQDRATFGDHRPPSHLRALAAIAHCRTAALGGHVYDGDHGDAYQSRDHACKNHHGPPGQNAAATAWLQRPPALRLPVPYVLVTFTWPDTLREWARRHQPLFYNLLCRSSAQALPALAWEPRVVGGQRGRLGVWHTWTPALHAQPPVHDRVPAGGLAAEGRQGRPSRENCLVPVQALAIRFRANVRAALRKPPGCDLVPAAVWEPHWVVHGAPVGSGSQALHDLAPDSFRVALRNHRSRPRADGQLSCPYRDSQTGALQVCTVTAAAFIRRFRQHVLPDHQRRRCAAPSAQA
jgi:Putative transposase/Transposase zinc-binding domain